MSEADLPIAELGLALRAGRTSSEVVTRRSLSRIAAMDGTLSAFVRVEGEAALAAARAADAELRQGLDRGPMHGVPYALKDIFDVAGLPTTCHSRLRSTHVAETDSEVAARFRRGGAVLLGKLATFEFALGGPSFDLPFPPARNPWNLACNTGGSSSGSAAAIAAGFVRLAPGSCTAGSIRGPAAWCGTVGLKPTRGRVSRRGVFPLSHTLDHCGPLSRSVEDAAIGLQMMAGHDGEDPGSVDVAVPDFRAGLQRGVQGLRLGVPRAFFAAHPNLADDARAGIEAALALLAAQGATVVEVDLPDYGLFLACGRVIMIAEAFALHRKDLQARPGAYGALTLGRFAAGVAIDADDYARALDVRQRLTEAVEGVLERCDGLVTAISLTQAPRLDAPGPTSAWPLQASPFNVTGHPAMSVPVGLGQDGLPLAIQVVGRLFEEATVLRIGRALEVLTGWERTPLPVVPHGAG